MSRWYWLQADHADRCTGPAKDRGDKRCHNKAFSDGLCKTHLRLAGKLDDKCPTCGQRTQPAPAGCRQKED